MKFIVVVKIMWGWVTSSRGLPLVAIFVSLCGVVFRLAQFANVGVDYLQFCSTSELVVAGLVGLEYTPALLLVFIACSLLMLLAAAPSFLWMKARDRIKRSPKAVAGMQVSPQTPGDLGAAADTTAAIDARPERVVKPESLARRAMMTLAVIAVLIAYSAGSFSSITDASANGDPQGFAYQEVSLPDEAPKLLRNGTQKVFFLASVGDCFVFWTGSQGAVIAAKSAVAGIRFDDSTGLLWRTIVRLTASVRGRLVASPYLYGATLLMALVLASIVPFMIRSVISDHQSQ